MNLLMEPNSLAVFFGDTKHTTRFFRTMEKNMLKVFYSPHATSIDNEAKRASGHADVPLSPLGWQQAQERGQHFAAKALDAVFHSDLQRAADTAQIAFVGRNVPLIPDARLREYNYGDMTQYPIAQIEAEFPKRVTEPFPHGESCRSWIVASCTTTVSTSPVVSTSRCLFLPESFLPPSEPCGPPRSVVLTDWLAMMPAERVASRPACTRERSRKVVMMCSQTPMSRNSAKYP